jgi:hypothetical protein
VSPKIRLGKRHIYLPRSRLVRLAIGLVLVLFGILGFLPIVGYWMIPLGLLVLSVDLPIARRWRRRLEVWWGEQRGRRNRRAITRESHGEGSNGGVDD